MLKEKIKLQIANLLVIFPQRFAKDKSIFLLKTKDMLISKKNVLVTYFLRFLR